MKKYFFLLLIVFFISIIFLFNKKEINSTPNTSNSVSTIEALNINDSNFIAYINNGKDEHISAAQLGNFYWDSFHSVELCKKADAEFNYSIQSDSIYALHFIADSISIDSIGKIGPFEIYQFSNMYMMQRAIVAKEACGKIRLIYAESDHCGSLYSGMNIVDDNGKQLSSEALKIFTLPNIQNQNSIHLKAFVGGNNEYWQALSFTYQAEQNVFKSNQ